MKATLDKIKVMQGYVDGRTLQRRSIGGSAEWEVYAMEPMWDWAAYDFRLTPEPKTVWINEYPNDRLVMHETKEKAYLKQAGDAIRVAVKFQEIGEDLS